MKAVYVVEATRGEYSDRDWWVAGVFATRKLAEQFVKAVEHEYNSYDGDRRDFKSKLDRGLTGRWDEPNYFVSPYRVKGS